MREAEQVGCAVARRRPTLRVGDDRERAEGGGEVRQAGCEQWSNDG